MKNLSSISRIAWAMLAITGCSPDKPSAEPPAKLDSVTASSTAAAVTSPGTALKEEWIVSEVGIGPVKARMTLQQLSVILPELKSSDDLATASCTYARSSSLPPGVVLMLENGRVARIDILTGSARTVEGAGIGDTEARLQSLYGLRLRTSPHKYTDGHYLTLASVADSTNKIVFETDGVKVLRFRSGKTPAVEYVEGCG